MANYGNGLDTKEKILNSAKKIFYEKGYEKTTFKEIGSDSNVNQGLIVYHFKTKANLANAVFREYIKAETAAVNSFFVSADNMTRLFISDYFYYRLIYQDPSFRNFMNSCCSGGFLVKEDDAVNDETYFSYFREITDEMSEDTGPDSDLLEAIVVANEGLKNSYTCHICNNYRRFSVREASENFIYLYCRLFGIPEEHYGPRMMEAQVYSNQVSIDIENFEFRMTKR